MNPFIFFEKSRKENWAIGQFNFSTLEQFKGITRASAKLKSPVVLGTSEGEASFLGMEEAAALAGAARKKGLSVFLHLDHGKSFETVKRAIRAGYDSVHIDGSALPFARNLKLTKKVVKYAQNKKVAVEGELGVIGGESEVGSGAKKSILTNPSEVKRFVEETGVTSLAVSIGNVHGITEKKPDIDLSLLGEIGKKVETPLVFHGGSGCSDLIFKKAIEAGVRKINVNTALRKTWREAVKEGLEEKSVKPYVVLKGAVGRVEERVEAYIRIFKSQNKA